MGLTARETSVLALLAAGFSNRGIARRLGCAPRTVEKHLERVYRKLGVRDNVNAVRVAHAWDLVAEPVRPQYAVASRQYRGFSQEDGAAQCVRQRPSPTGCS